MKLNGVFSNPYSGLMGLTCRSGFNHIVYVCVCVRVRLRACVWWGFCSVFLH